MIEAIFHSLIFCYQEIFHAETFLDVRMCRTCQVENDYREVSAKLAEMIFRSSFPPKGKFYLIEIKWSYSYLFSLFYIFYFGKKINIYICLEQLLYLKNRLLEFCAEIHLSRKEDSALNFQPKF